VHEQRLEPARVHERDAEQIADDAIAHGARRTQGVVNARQFGARNACLVVRGLRTVRAVLGTPTTLDVQEHGSLNFVRHMVLAVDELCLEDEVDERCAIDPLDVAEGPVVTHEAPL